LLELDDVERRLKPFRRRYLGVRAVPLDALVGADGRANAFTRDFRPLHASSRDRLRSLRRAFGDGGYPPIVAVKLGEAYFVIDGHHCAALASKWRCDDRRRRSGSSAVVRARCRWATASSSFIGPAGMRFPRSAASSPRRSSR